MHTKPILILSLLISLSLALLSCSNSGGDNDQHRTLSISADSPVNEGDSVDFMISLDRANDTGAPVRGAIRLAGVSTDDITYTSTQYEIPVNERTATLSVGIRADGQFENTETLTADLDGAPPGVSIRTGRASVQITDNDSAELSISAVSDRVNEGQQASFVVSLDRVNNTGSAITGIITFTDSAGQTSRLYNIADAVQTVSITVSTTASSGLDNTKTLTADLGDPGVSGVSLGTITASVEIIDNDSAELSISAVSDRVTEGQQAGFVVSLSLVNNTGSTIAGTIAFTDSSDLTPTGTTATQYVISDGEQSSSVTVTIWNDGLIEDTETLSAELIDPNVSGVSLGTYTATVTIIDNDNAPGSVTASLSVLQHGNDASPSVSIVYLLTLAKVNNTGSPITFTTTLTGTASPTLTTPADYDTPSLMEISVADGALTGTFTVKVNNDSIPDENETLGLTIANPSHPAINIVTDTATADILDSLKTGQFKLSGNVQGLEYESDGQTGTTTATGSFTYTVGKTVTFSFAGITLGTTFGKRIITPLDLVENGSVESGRAPTFDAVMGRTLFLLLLDKDGDTQNGVEITEATRNHALTPGSEWATDATHFPAGFLDQSWASFTITMNIAATGAVAQLGGLSPTETHILPEQIVALYTLRNHTLNCVNSGIYLGTFTGDDHGRIGVLRHHAVMAMAYSDAFTQTYHLFDSITVPFYDQDAAFTGVRDVYENIALDGNFTSVNSVGGTWTNTTTPPRIGTFTATRVGGDWHADYRLVGAITEDPLERGSGDKYRGLFDLQLDANTTPPTVDGSLYWLGGAGDDWVETPIDPSRTIFTAGPVRSLIASFEDNTVITTSNVFILSNDFTLSASWARPPTPGASGASGLVRQSYGCRLN